MELLKGIIMDSLTIWKLSSIGIPAINIIIAIGIGWIALNQYVVNKNKLRLDLYNKRFEIFVTTLHLYQAVLEFDSSEEHLESSINEFNLRHRNFIVPHLEAEFLFDNKSGIIELLDEIGERSFGVYQLKKYMREYGKQLGKEVLEPFSRTMDDLKWLNENILEIKKPMARYLNFHKI